MCGMRNRISRSGWWAAAVLLAMLGLSAPGAAAERSPTEGVKATVDEFFYILTELKDPSRSAQRNWEFEQAVRRHVRYEEMARQSLGEAWAGVSPAERRQFVRLFVQILRDELTERLRGYNAREVAFVSEQGEQGRAEVGATLTSADLETRMDFVVARGSGDWMIEDIRIDGTSLLERYRAQFARILKEATFADLMERMKQRTLLVEVFEKAGP